jgi:hypothetical protein
MDQQEYENKCTEILVNIPSEFHSAMRQIAYELGHAYGYQEICSVLNDLAYFFTEPIRQYTKRICGKREQE